VPPTTLRLRPELETSLLKLPGIQAARVVTDGSAAPTEIHILADREKTPKQLVRDIQSLAMAQFDIEIDHRIVSIVQFDEGETAPPSPDRVLIASITTQNTGFEATTTVSLAHRGRLYDGTSTAPSTTSSRPRAVARATLAAVLQILNAGACDIEIAQIVSVGGRDVAVSLVQVVTSDGEHIVTGSALVRGDDADAVARSVLDALNRRLAEVA
jgi:hypothetical protein